MVEKHTQKVIGDIGIHFIGKEEKEVEIGCTVNKKYQHQGYATEALGEVINQLFSSFNKEKIIASIDPENQNSIQLVKKLGFKKKAHYQKKLFLHGKWVDDVIYELTKID